MLISPFLTHNINNFVDVSDMSQPSLSGIIGDRDDRDREEPTPPISPFIGSEGTSATAKSRPTLYTQKSAPNFSRKYQDSSLDGDDTESELVAIPESDLSESTLHNSVPGSFDDGVHFDEMAQPLKSDQIKGKVTTANLATAQVALTTLGVAERMEEKQETKKTSRLFMKLNSLDKSSQKHTTTDSTKIVTKCSVQEGVRMMVTPSIFMTPQTPLDTAVLNQQANVQRAVVVTQDNKAGKDVEVKIESKDAKDTSEVDCSKSAIGSLLTEASTSVAKQIAMGSSKPLSKK